MLKHLLHYLSHRTLPQRKLTDNMGLVLQRRAGQSLIILRVDSTGQVQEEMKIKLGNLTPGKAEIIVEGRMDSMIILREEVYESHKRNPVRSLLEIGRKRTRPEQSLSLSLQKGGVTSVMLQELEDTVRTKIQEFVRGRQKVRVELQGLQDFMTKFSPEEQSKPNAQNLKPDQVLPPPGLTQEEIELSEQTGAQIPQELEQGLEQEVCQHCGHSDCRRVRHYWPMS